MLLTACAPEVQRGELVGEYKADFGIGTNSLFLRDDGTYIRVVHSPGFALVQLTNKWEFEDWKGRKLITFYGFSGDPLAAEASDAFWPAVVERYSNGLKLSIDRDLNRAFRKPTQHGQ